MPLTYRCIAPRFFFIDQDRERERESRKGWGEEFETFATEQMEPTRRAGMVMYRRVASVVEADAGR